MFGDFRIKIKKKKKALKISRGHIMSPKLKVTHMSTNRRMDRG